MWHSNLEKKYIYFSTYPPPISLRLTSASKPAAYKSFDGSLSHFRTSVSTSSSSAKRLPPSYEPLYATNTSHRKQETFLYEYPLHWALLPTKKTHNRTLLFCSILLKHGRHVDCGNQPLSMRIRICYLDCHESGPCCYLVIHIENLLRPLLLFYFHLWRIYWPSLLV
jgi:hypothetical protein